MEPVLCILGLANFKDYRNYRTGIGCGQRLRRQRAVFGELTQRKSMDRHGILRAAGLLSFSREVDKQRENGVLQPPRPSLETVHHYSLYKHLDLPDLKNRSIFIEPT